MHLLSGKQENQQSSIPSVQDLGNDYSVFISKQLHPTLNQSQQNIVRVPACIGSDTCLDQITILQYVYCPVRTLMSRQTPGVPAVVQTHPRMTYWLRATPSMVALLFQTMSPTAALTAEEDGVPVPLLWRADILPSVRLLSCPSSPVRIATNCPRS